MEKEKLTTFEAVKMHAMFLVKIDHVLDEAPPPIVQTRYHWAFKDAEVWDKKMMIGRAHTAPTARKFFPYIPVWHKTE